MSPTPYRYAEKSVFRYAPILVLIQEHEFPKRLEFDPLHIGVNSETAACRIRDAAHSLCTGLTSHPSIDPTLLAERFRHYRVSHDGTKVFVIPKTEKKQSTAAHQVEIVSQTVGGTDVLARVKGEDMAVLAAFALLLGRQFLHGKIEIVGEISDDALQKLQETNDISICSESPQLHFMF